MDLLTIHNRSRSLRLCCGHPPTMSSCAWVEPKQHQGRVPRSFKGSSTLLLLYLPIAPSTTVDTTSSCGVDFICKMILLGLGPETLKAFCRTMHWAREISHFAHESCDMKDCNHISNNPPPCVHSLTRIPPPSAATSAPRPWQPQ